MFYIGGAHDKKKAVRNIFKVSDVNDGILHEIDPENDNDDADSKNDTKHATRSRSISRSNSRSRSRSRFTNKSDDESEIETETETDELDETDTVSSNTEEENHDYIATIGSINTDGFHHHYKFVEDELDYDIEEFAEQHPEIKHYDMVIYRMNTKSSTAFLEFLFYYENSVCKLPFYKHATKKHIRKECDDIMKQLFSGKYRYRGYLYDELTGKCYIFCEKYFREDKVKPELLSLQHTHNWFWICTTEIIYQKKYMTLAIHDDAIDLFNAYPLLGILQATIPFQDVRVRRVRADGGSGGRIKNYKDERFQIVNIEAPTILYYGSTLCYAENTALYGLKREPLTSRFGPFYYFTSLDHSYYWACYHNTSKHTKKERNVEGGISRYAVFTKRMKTIFHDDDYDVDMVKKYVERKNIFETKINQYRQTQEVYHHDMYDSIYSQDYTWTTNYDTIYNGLYDTTKLIRPVWCVCDHRNFQLLSYYEVDTKNIPDTYEPSYLDYKIM